MPLESWDEGVGYEQYVGRWSRLAAAAFLRWLGVPSGLRWLDVGCGTGALAEAILDVAGPEEVVGVDQSEHYLAFARQCLALPRVRFERGDAASLPVGAAQFDIAVSGLMLNFVPSPAVFWDAAIALDPDAEALDEGVRFRICAPDALHELFSASGLGSVAVASIDVRTPFRDFDDFWRPFLTAQGPAPSYAAGLSDGAKARLRDRLWRMLPVNPDGSIALIARAWAVRGSVAV